MMQKKDNAPNNQLKRSQKMEDKKGGKPSAKKIVARVVLSKGKRSTRIPSPPIPSHDM
jgi:hypothetical protein